MTETASDIHISSAPTPGDKLNDPDASFTPMNWTMQEIRSAIPARLFVRSTLTSVEYLLRDLLMAGALLYAGSHIDRLAQTAQSQVDTNMKGLVQIGRWAAWLAYWWFQGLTFTGLWVVGHECGHGAFSPNRVVCDTIGFVIHSLLWTPYFSWGIGHHRHHANHNSMERDEVYVPKTRSDLGIPSPGHHEQIDWEEYLGDTPIYTLFTLVRQQLLAFPAYLLFNVSGQKSYPWPTSHFDPYAVLFTPSQRHLVHLSNLGLLLTGLLLKYLSASHGALAVLKLYGVPWLLVTHWFIMITYLHHTDPEVPHYRGKAWSFQRGASSTVDRDFLGWQGRFFLHGVAHWHVVHHFFPTMPHYHTEEATEHLKAFIGQHYHSSEQPIFKALWHNYNECQFVEDQGDVLFYRNRQGKPATL